MSYSITLETSGRQFVCDPEDTILNAALKAGITLPYSCKNGACGTCKGKLVQGDIEEGQHQAQALTSAEKSQGMALLCCAKPKSDCTVAARELTGVGDMPIRKMPCRVTEMNLAAPDVMVLTLQLPSQDRLQFMAGQYVDLLLKDGKRRSYSIANAPQREGSIDLHVRHVPGGVFTDHCFTAMKPRDILRFEGPLGTFFLRDAPADVPFIFLASGTGFGPIKAMLESLAHQESLRPVSVYWGGRRRVDLYQHAWLEQYVADHAHVRYVPVLSEPSEDCQWQGRTGLVHQAVLADWPDMRGVQVYACGAPVVVDSARRDFSRDCGLPEEAFFADAFTPSGV